jgi:ferritin-like metal-binding protein YciE
MESGLQKAFVDELRDAYDAEKQLIRALPKLAKAATAEELKTAFLDHLDETKGHATTLEGVFKAIGERVRGKHCDGIAGIIEEGKAIMREDFGGATMDACLVAAGQRSEHYEIAAYGTLVAWANVLGHTKAAELLKGILDEETAADEKLSALAESGINKQAGGEDDEADADEGETGHSAMGLLRRTVRSLTGGPSNGSGAREGKSTSGGSRRGAVKTARSVKMSSAAKSRKRSR